MDLPDFPIVERARELTIGSRLWGSAVEAGIRSGSWDHGEIVAGFFNEAEQCLLREQIYDENIPDD